MDLSGLAARLYGLKIAFENLDDSFTFNQSERLAKEIDHADLRLAELKGALAANRTDAADQALDQYWQNLNQTEGTLAGFNETRSMPPLNGTGTTPSSLDPALMNAQEMILRHQFVLEDLLSAHPDNPGLARAYENSRAFELKLEQKAQTRSEGYQDADNQTKVRTQHLNPGTGNQVQNETSPVDTGGRSGPAGNMTGSEPGNGRQGQAGQTGNASEQTSNHINPSMQDQQRPATLATPGHTTSPQDYSGNRDTNSGGTNRQSDNQNNNGNGNRR